LKLLFDHVTIQDEPINEYIYNVITERTIQQRQQGDLESWTGGIYKMFKGISNLLEYIDEYNLIQNDEIALRIRLDMIIELNQNIWELIFNNLLTNHNEYYVNFVRGCANYSDWFGITSYNNLKKIWYFDNLNILNNYIKNSYCSEKLIENRCTHNNIKSINIKNISYSKPNNYVVRKYISDTQHKKHYYE
jgi:hypothetical protein